MKTLTSSILAFCLFACVANGASIAISIDTADKSLRDEINVPLSGGNPAVNGDGTQVLLGYFSDATAGNPFGTAGLNAVAAFTALTGPGTPFGINFTIGDQVINSPSNGELFVDSFSINTGINDALFPAAGTPLVLRFFNASQTFLVDVSNTSGTWNWATPNTPPPLRTLAFSDVGLVYRASGSNSRGTVSATAQTNIQTNNVVPEPATGGLLALGLAFFAARSRRLAA